MGWPNLKEYDDYIIERAESQGKIVKGEWVDRKLKYIVTGER